MDVDEVLAEATLRALVQVPGALKIITDEVRPELRRKASDPRSPVKESVLAADPEALKKAATFVWHDVVSLEGPDGAGVCRARSAEGDWTVGRPAALLRRLQEWRG